MILMFVFQYELLFCVEDKSDPAVMVVMQLMEKYPSISSRLFTGKIMIYFTEDVLLDIERYNFILLLCFRWLKCRRESKN